MKANDLLNRSNTVIYIRKSTELKILDFITRELERSILNEYNKLDNKESQQYDELKSNKT